jgi:Ca2+-binding RTX toxin-like protein
VTVENYFRGANYRIERFEFSDGVVWDEAAIGGQAVVQTMVTGALVESQESDDPQSAGLSDDTYTFNIGDGSVFIEDVAEAGAGNTIVFGSNITPDDLTLIPYSDMLTIRVGDAGDEINLTVFDQSDLFGPHAVDTFRFADGTVLSYSELLQMGFDIDGSADADTLYGTLGTDTYLFNLGDGVDTIRDSAVSGEGNVIEFGTGISTGDLTFSVDETTLVISVGANGDALRLERYDKNDPFGTMPVQTFRFADGTKLSYIELLQLGSDISGTVGEDLLIGTSGADRIVALGGDDIMESGPGSDLLEGGSGNDTYVFNLGDGVDTIRDAAAPGAGNVVDFGIGISSADLTLSADGNTLVISVGSTGDALRIEGFDPENPYTRIHGLVSRGSRVGFRGPPLWAYRIGIRGRK